MWLRVITGQRPCPEQRPGQGPAELTNQRAHRCGSQQVQSRLTSAHAAGPRPQVVAPALSLGTDRAAG